MYLRFPIWKPAPGNDGPCCVRIQGSNAKFRWSIVICLVTVKRGKSCDTISFVKLIIDGNGMSVLLMGIKPSCSNLLMVESDGLLLLKDCLEGIVKHLLVFLASNIIFIGQLEKDIGLRLHVAQCLSPADQ